MTQYKLAEQIVWIGKVVLSALALTVTTSAQHPELCGPGKKILIFGPEEDFSRYADPLFIKEMFHQLKVELSEIGYCLSEAPRRAQKDTLTPSTLVFSLGSSVSETVLSEAQSIPEDNSNPLLIVAVLEKDRNDPGSLREALSKPLVSFMFDPEDLLSLKSIVVKKIVENLRLQYVCHIRIHSNPDGAQISSISGLDAITPVEWIQPLGKLSVHAFKDGYEQLYKDLDLSEPGVHTFYLQLRKRQFYNSRFIYPAITAGLGSILFYSLEQHYYHRYSKLGKDDYFNHPDRFRENFNKAKRFQQLTLASLLITGVSVGLSLKY